MKGIRFYEEFHDAARKESAGTCLAVEGAVFRSGGEQCYEGAGGVYACPNSPCASTSFSLGYLAEFCRRVSEQRAREIHPQLFRYLEG